MDGSAMDDQMPTRPLPVARGDGWHARAGFPPPAGAGREPGRARGRAGGPARRWWDTHGALITPYAWMAAADAAAFTAAHATRGTGRAAAAGVVAAAAG